MTASITGCLLIFVISWLCFRMSRLHRKLASAYRLIAQLIPENDLERRTLLSAAERQRMGSRSS